MNLQPRHYPHVMIIVITMIGTAYFLHKSDQKKLQRDAAFTREKLELFAPKPKAETKNNKCETTVPGYRCFTKKNDSK